MAVASVVLIYAAPGEFDLAIGEVSPQDIRAPREVTFISEILSEQARQDAARRVNAIYTPPDPQIARQQYARGRSFLEYVRALRADRVGPPSAQAAWLRAVPELEDLSDSVVNSILTLPDSSWSRVQIEFLDLLDRVMRQEEISEADLFLIRNRIPSMVPLELAQDEAEVVEDLVSRFVQPNVFYDAEATEAAIAAARDAVDPAIRQYRSGEVIIREGTALSRLDVEALEELGLTSATQDEYNVFAVMLFSGVATMIVGVFIYRLDPTALDGGKQELLIAAIVTVFLGLAWILIRSGELVPYLYPGAAAGMLIATTVGPVPGVASALLVSAVSGWVGAQSLKITAMVLLGGLFAIFTLPRYEQTGALFRSGMLGGIVQALVIFVFSMDELTVSPLGLMIKMSLCVLGGLISGALTVGGLFVLTPIFDLTTTFRLTELSRPNHPLLQRLLREAPATFNHVMMVTSLAEQAAERIKANVLLTRVGAYYHDIGKLSRPYFFVENQQGLSNPHDRLDPYTSVDVLVGHVRDGIKLAKQYRLPAQVRAFIPEHHGTMRVGFFYQKAVEAAGGEADLVDEAQFRYPGPKPQSRETLLLMLADSSEAATRAVRPSTAEELEALIDRIFEQRMKDGQLDDCPITMAELHTVKRTYVNLLRGAFHPRVQYPEAQVAEPGTDQHAAAIEMEEAELFPSLDDGEGVAETGVSAAERIRELILLAVPNIETQEQQGQEQEDAET